MCPRGRTLVILSHLGSLLLAGQLAASSPQAPSRKVADWIGPARGPVGSQPTPAHTADGPAELRVGPPLSPIEEGVTWLESNQNANGSWGTSFPLIVTSTAIESFSIIRPQSPSQVDAAAWLAGETAPNHEFLARQVIGLAGVPGYETLVAGLAADLVALRNPATTNTSLPNWPEGGWGLAAGYETDCLTTALALKALDAAGLGGGLKVIGRNVAAGTTNTHEWNIAADATTVRIVITVSGSTVRLRMKQGVPPGAGDPFFSLPSGSWLIVFPTNAPFTPGHNYITIQNTTAVAATYTMTASYQTPAIDTRSIDESLEYLRQAQNVDGGWGLQRGQSTEIYTTFHVILTLLEYGNYEFSADIAQGTDYVRLQQLGDGSFGYSGSGIPYVTALAALCLIRSETYPFTSDVSDARTALLAMQEVDGSWVTEAYDTALAILAIWDHNQTPSADAGPDQNVSDADENCLEDVTLAGSGSDVDGTIVEYLWTKEGVEIALGPAPTVQLTVGVHILTLTVRDDLGKTDSDTVAITVTGSGIPATQCHCCLADGGCADVDAIECADLGGQPIPGACDLTACCLGNGACQEMDTACCTLQSGSTISGESCTLETVACCLTGGDCSTMDSLCCESSGGSASTHGTECVGLEACCLPDGNCELMDPPCCGDIGGTSMGLETICNPPEACCLPDQNCQTIDPSCCLALGGTPQGPDTACTAATSCCLEGIGCEFLDPLCCAAQEGTSLAGTCDPFQACCLSDNTCLDLEPQCCLDRGGAPSGSGTACAATGPEACCLNDNTCETLDPQCCLDQGGQPAGDNTACAAAEACCLPDDSCQLIAPDCCLSAGGSPQGTGSTCSMVQGCCLPDDSCQQLSSQCCLSRGGLPLGPTNDCSAVESCCFSDNSCEFLDPLCCAGQGGLPGGPASSCPSGPCCFVDGLCSSPEENPCTCPDDCGAPPVTETNCSDGLDNDCDAEVDCDDADCAADTNCSAPPNLEPDPSGFNKPRFISFSVPPAPVASTAVGSATAIRVKLISLHHVEPPYSGGPSVPFTSFEGQVRWVGPPVQYFESSASQTPFFASALQCTPHYQDWSTLGQLYVTGSAIPPSSQFEVENVAAICMGTEETCTAISEPLSVDTTRWGDVEVPFNPPDPTAQPNASDIGALVNKFRGALGAPIKARALLAGSDQFGNISIAPDFSFIHIAACVDAFRGTPYPYQIQACP